MAIYTSYAVFEQNLELVQGAPFVFAFKISNNGSPIDGTGCTIDCDFKANKGEPVAFTPSQDLSDAANGNFKLTLTAVQTVNATGERYLYDMYVFDSTGVLFMRVWGQVAVIVPVATL